MTTTEKPPFYSTYSPNIPEILWKNKLTIAITTYQAGKVIFISANSENGLIQLPRDFRKAMGMAYHGGKMAIATREEVVILKNTPSLAKGYPKMPNTYDGLFMPRATYMTGEVDLHDMAWGQAGLWAVNTRFSCLSMINDDYSFEPKWQPSFISDLVPEDRCHLNGMAMKNGHPEFVTSLGTTNSAFGWRENKAKGGAMIHVPSGEILTTGLAMPHSPRLEGNKLFALLSATGELIEVDQQSGKYEVVTKIPGFVRGMSRYGNLLFIGLSKMRKSSPTFKDLPIAQESIFPGIVVVDANTGKIVGHIKYETSLEEIYDVKIISGMLRPGIMGVNTDDHRNGLSLPTQGFWAVPEEPKKIESE
ncbi:TIGR03032 family protein [Reichenbachiella faecimaris]|uniref:TIGR03032 family protein n=1 Tax=Reichenbachiella faecimaris TaxID=692418 RepID=A0A1W2GE77_REIFA|nr:TIGR03032 family protein [Reichenbachiella faecimaris]SMD34638.1 TIGR03032 family protein [Reichenbachiella faecimaris]